MDDERYMELAINLAEFGRGFTYPNPLVGAVIVNRGRIVGLGYHKKQGLPHAEVNAIFDARGHTKGATMYVTLEPHSFYGHQPPCTKAIIRAGIKRVVIGAIDPNPLVNGEGVKQLAEHGIEVKVGVLEEKVIEQNEVYFKYTKTGMPFVYLKLAATMDGFLADEEMKSQWISGPESRILDHRWRGEVDAVAVGKGTLLHDNPRLTPRDVYPARIPERLIFASKLDFSTDFYVFDTTIVPTSIITSDTEENRKEAVKFLEKNVNVIFVPPDEEGKPDLEEALKILGSRGVRSILFEGGAYLAGKLVDRNLWDKIYLFQAPLFFGNGISILQGMRRNLKIPVKARIKKIERVGNDLLIVMSNERKNY